MKLITPSSHYLSKLAGVLLLIAEPLSHAESSADKAEVSVKKVSLVKPDVKLDAESVSKIHVNDKQGAAVIRRELLALASGKNTSVVVDISRQRAYLLVNGKIAVETPVSTGKPGHNTPRGSFVITERQRAGKVSNRYNASMPFWMRLGNSPFGMHTGMVPGKPASHGCIRLPSKVAPIMFAGTSSGTTVRVVSKWTPPSDQPELASN